jgi:carbon monoxide dehydrogenase subunit G
MNLNNEAVVAAPIDRVWALLDDVENVVACMPGATYIGREGDDHSASIKVKVGAISTNFRGKFRFLEKDEAARTIRIQSSGKDVGGKASANATITIKLEPQTPTSTRAGVNTDLALTGPLAQFGGGIIGDIASRMIGQFTQNVDKAILASGGVNSDTTHVTAEVVAKDPEPKAIEAAPSDVGNVLMKRALPYSWIVVAILVVGVLLFKFG